MKRLTQFLFLVLITPIVWCNDISAQSAGFESGNIAGWTSSGGEVAVVGSTTVSPGGGKTWVINPYGTKMAQIQPTGGVQFNTATASLGLSTAENTAIRNYLTSLGGNSTPTNAGWIKRELTLQAGTTYTFGWNYVSTDYTPFNDGSMMTLTHATNASIIPNLNNSQLRYALLGFTNPGTGNYATDSYGSTGWQQARFTVPETGTYVLGFASFNLGDTALSPLLFIDELQGTTTLNGATFNPVAPNAGSSAPPAEPPPPPPPAGPTVVGGTITQTNAPSNQTITSIAGKTPAQQLNFNTWNNNPQSVNNYLYIDQVTGNLNNVTVSQTGTKNTMNIGINGDSNIINNTQTGSNYLNNLVQGNTNTVTSLQTNTAGGHYQETKIMSGNNNTINVTQKDNSNNLMFNTVTGSNNSVTAVQEGTGGHYLENILTGNGHTVLVNQSGSTANNASISLTNNGGAASVDLNQTGGKGFNIIQSCANPAGCSTVVKQ
jgi:hypothetical protein